MSTWRLFLLPMRNVESIGNPKIHHLHHDNCERPYARRPQEKNFPTINEISHMEQLYARECSHPLVKNIGGHRGFPKHMTPTVTTVIVFKKMSPTLVKNLTCRTSTCPMCLSEMPGPQGLPWIHGFHQCNADIHMQDVCKRKFAYLKQNCQPYIEKSTCKRSHPPVNVVALGTPLNS